MPKAFFQNLQKKLDIQAEKYIFVSSLLKFKKSYKFRIYFTFVMNNGRFHGTRFSNDAKVR